jgi:hypothetical protein
MATTSMLHSSSSFGMRSMLVMAEPIRVDGEPSKKSPGYYLLEAFRVRRLAEVQQNTACTFVSSARQASPCTQLTASCHNIAFWLLRCTIC